MPRKTTTVEEELEENEKVPSHNGDLPDDFHLFGPELQDALMKRDAMFAERYNTTIYREAGPKGKHVNLGNVNGSIPLENEVGEKFGRGTYRLWISYYSRKKKKNESFTIFYPLDDEIWDVRKAEADQKKLAGAGSGTAGTVVGGPPPVDPMAMMNMTMGMVSTMVREIVSPILSASKQQGQQNDPFKMMASMGDLMTTNFQRMASWQDEFLKLRSPEANIPQTEAEETDLIKEVIGMIVEKAQEILNMGPFKTKVARREMQNYPEFQQIISNPKLLQQTVSGVEKEIGAEKTKTILQKFGIPVQ